MPYRFATEKNDYSDYAGGHVFYGTPGQPAFPKGKNKMIPENRIPTHPGVVLEEEFLNPMGLTQVALAKHLGIPTQRINELIRGKRGVTPQTAWLLAGAFGTTPQFWLNLQANYDLAVNRPQQEIQPLALAT
jgi:antitoxin HigA-1